MDKDKDMVVLWVDGGGSGFWYVELLSVVKGRWGDLSWGEEGFKGEEGG